MVDPPPVRGVANGGRLAVTTMPLSLLNVRRRIRAGVLYRQRRWDYLLDLEYGPQWIAFWFTEAAGRRSEFYGLRAEARYCLDVVGITSRSSFVHYLGVEFPINTEYRDLRGRSFQDADGERYRFDEARRRRFRMSLLPKYTLGVSGNRWQIETYLGIGVAYRWVHYADQVGRRLANRLEDDGWLIGETAPAGVGIVADLALGFRVAYFVK